MSEKEKCEHKWAPYQQWLGRYVCEMCKVVGYTDGKDFAYLGVRSTHGGKISPYKCSKSDKKTKVVCTNLATSIVGDLALCDEHKDNIKISSAERRFHEAIERQNAKNEKMLDEAFKKMREATEEALGRKKDNGK